MSYCSEHNALICRICGICTADPDHARRHQEHWRKLRSALGNLRTRRGQQLIEWIAMNDSPASADTKATISGYLTVAMLAQVYGVKPLAIAMEIERIRKEENLL
jgi:hypothetical protein